MQAHLDQILSQYRITPGVYVVPDYAQTILGMDPALLDQLIANYPVRGQGDAIQRGQVQWIDGEHAALRYRGNVLRRCKIWLQRGATATVGFLRYRYTGWQWRVLPATVDVAGCPEVAPVADMYDAWCDRVGALHANHYILTWYEDGQHSIGWHFDKAESIDPDSLITVVKLGGHGRPFALRHLATQHSVPEVQNAGRSGSIVFRTITESFTEAQVAAELAARGIPF